MDTNIQTNPIVPPQKEGKHNDLCEERILEDSLTAGRIYDHIRQRLLHPESWEKIADTSSVSFRVYDASGHPVERAAQAGDYYRIDLAGPGPSAGDGYDWVRVDAVEEHNDKATGAAVFGLRLTACAAPFGDEPDAAHFFKQGASSSFVLERKDATVRLSYHGRNEKPNTSTSHLADNIRNAITGVAAMLGFSEMQWSALLKGLLHVD